MGVAQMTFIVGGKSVFLTRPAFLSPGVSRYTIAPPEEINAEAYRCLAFALRSAPKGPEDGAASGAACIRKR